MRVFLQEWATEVRSPVTLVVWLASSLIFGLAGPLGTFYLMPALPRIGMWMLLLAGAILAATAIRSFVHSGLGLRDFWRGSSLVAVLATGLLTLPYSAMASALFGHQPWQKPATAEIGAFIFFVAMGIGAYRHTAAPAPIAAPPEGKPAPLAAPAAPETTLSPPAAPSVAPEPLPRLVQRLDPGLQGRLVSVSVRDHYVDVVTLNGSASLLMRLSDAIAETEGEEGAQIHRSHWVARHAVQAVDRAGGKVALRLVTGGCLPVSRANRPKIDGWVPAQA